MSGVTYNQQTFPRKRNKLNLKSNPNLQIFDTSPTSDKFFNIVDFPEKFTAGKNLFKVKAAAGTLVDQAPVYIEILDFNGDPIYHETINYAEHDGTRVVSVWIYADTPPGPAVVYLSSRAAYDEETGVTYPYSTDLTDQVNGPLAPNLIWSRTVTVSPELRNDTEIIFLQQPKVIIEEVTQPYLQVSNLRGINIASSGSGTVTVRPYGSAGIIVNGSGPGTTNQGGGTLGSPPSNVGSQFLQQPLITAENLTGPTSVTASPIFTVNSVSLLESTGFTLEPEMVGGTITVSDPSINITTNAAGSSFEIENNELLPSSNPNDFPQQTTTVPTIASGSFEFLITEVLNSSQAKVAQISGFRDATLNTNGAFVFPYTQINSQGQRTIHSLNRIESSANFTASYFRPPTTVVTEQSQSFAEIRLENLSPATGDVYKVKTLFKAGGLFGDFEDLGDTILEEFELLEDADNLETSIINGVIKNRIGFFTSLGDFETYWTGSGGSITPDQAVTTVFNPGNIISGVQIKPTSTFDDTTNRFAYIHISSSQYHADLKPNTTYKLRFRAHATDSPASTDTNVGKPRIDVYVSGSTRNSITVADDATRNSAYVLNATPTQLQDSLQGIFEDANAFGKRIGTVEFNASQSINDAAFNFIANEDDTADIYFVLRRGSWTLADISLVAVKETGFTPNITRINKRIPRTYFDTPLTFRFQFLDYRNNIADMESYVYPVTFRGENTVITGVNNIVSGSLFLNTFPGGGIEMHGGSAFIRSVGYQGFTSASAGVGQGFLLYSGSVLPDSGDNYTGAGFEVYVTSSAYISARTDTNELIIKANSIEVGSLTATTSSIQIKGSSNSYSGSFSGSFEGDGSGLTGITADINTGSFATTGSNIFIGDQIITGSITISGSTELGGDIFPQSPQGATLGTADKPFSDLFLQSGSISIESDTPGDPSAVISNVSGNLEISVGGMRLVEPGNSFIAETGSFSFISGSMTQIGDYIQTGDKIINGNLSASGNITTNALTASGLIYPTVDGENGDVIQTDGAGNLSFGRTRIYAQVKNISGAVLPKGIPVHVTSSVGNLDEVIAASASDASTMPATFVLAQQLNDDEEGLGILTGFINGVDTSGFNEGDVVYVAPNGGYTNQKPSGSNLIQNLGIVTKVAVNGSGFIYGSGRSNDVPNLLSGQIFFGSGSDQSHQIHISGALDQTIINNITASGDISASGEITTNGFTNIGSTSTTLSSSFTTTLDFSTNRIMSVTTGSALTMSIDGDLAVLGNVIMTDISSSVGLNLPSSDFKVLNGTFDTTKRNYVYYHYIGNDTALVTINQEQ